MRKLSKHLIVGNHFRNVERQLAQMSRILSDNMNQETEEVMCGAAEVEGMIKHDLKRVEVQS